VRTSKERFPLGEIRGAGLHILSYAPDGDPNRNRRDVGKEWKYKVEFDCCGRKLIIAHVSIEKRLKTPRKDCQVCSLRKGRRKIKHGAGEAPWIDVPWPPASTARPKP
jgi:hypothetical protein